MNKNKKSGLKIKNNGTLLPTCPHCGKKYFADNWSELRELIIANTIKKCLGCGGTIEKWDAIGRGCIRGPFVICIQHNQTKADLK